GFRPVGDGRTDRQTGAKPAGEAANQPPATPPDRPQFFLYVQCASDTTARDLRLAQFQEDLDDNLDILAAESHYTLASFRKNLLLICLATFIAAAVGGYLVLLAGLNPLKRLGDAVSKVTPKDFKLPVDDRHLPVELQPIALRLNETLDLLK